MNSTGKERLGLTTYFEVSLIMYFLFYYLFFIFIFFKRTFQWSLGDWSSCIKEPLFATFNGNSRNSSACLDELPPTFGGQRNGDLGTGKGSGNGMESSFLVILASVESLRRLVTSEPLRRLVIGSLRGGNQFL